MSAVRLRVLESSDVPLVRRLAAFHAGTTPAFKHEMEIYITAWVFAAVKVHTA